MFAEEKKKMTADIATQLVVAVVSRTSGFVVQTFRTPGYDFIVKECVIAAKMIIDESYKDEQKPAR